jgi:glutamine phosphoribosylpyrophosphate amidotransferase
MMEDYDFMSIVMYPDLKNRREFIHDCWTIAKARENDELKVAISLDGFFYLIREDLLMLLKTHDNKMITHILKTNCNLHILEDTGYKLIMIKG